MMSYNPRCVYGTPAAAATLCAAGLKLLLCMQREDQGAWLWCSKDDLVIDAVRKVLTGSRTSVRAVGTVSSCRSLSGFAAADDKGQCGKPSSL